MAASSGVMVEVDHGTHRNYGPPKAQPLDGFDAVAVTYADSARQRPALRAIVVESQIVIGSTNGRPYAIPDGHGITNEQ
jgi:hypothetical protein